MCKRIFRGLLASRLHRVRDDQVEMPSVDEVLVAWIAAEVSPKAVSTRPENNNPIEFAVATLGRVILGPKNLSQPNPQHARMPLLACRWPLRSRRLV